MKRNQSLDSIKGILIILVVLGHSLQYGFGPLYEKGGGFYDDFIFRGIYSFHVPSFMMISGYLFCHSNTKPFFTMIMSKIKYIGVPFLVYSTIIYIIWWNAYVKGSFYFSDFFRKMHLHLWFLSSLLMNCIIIGCITHVFSKKYHIYLVIMVCFLFMFISDTTILCMHKYVLFFFVLGYFMNPFKNVRVTELIQTPLFFILLSICLIGCLFFYDKKMMIYEGGFCVLFNCVISGEQIETNICRFIINIISILWFASFFFVFVNKSPRIVTFSAILGRYTLPIYGLQSIFYLILCVVLDKNNINIHYNCISPLVFCVIILVLSWVLIRVFNNWRLCRFLFLGRK